MSNPKNEPWYAAGDPWMLSQTEWDPARTLYFETIFTQSNGYLGVRGYTEEGAGQLASCREGYLAGVFGHIDAEALKQVRIDYPWPMLCMVTLPELFACEVELEGERLRLDAGRLVSFRRTLDMRNGVLTREVDWVSPAGRQTRLRFERFLSAAIPHLAMQQITLTPVNWSGAAELAFQLDGQYPSYFRCGDRAMAHLPQQLLEQARVEADGATGLLAVSIRGTGHAVALASAITGGTCVATAPGGTTLAQRVALDVRAGEAATVVRAVAVASSRDQVGPEQTPGLALGAAREAREAGYAAARSESEAAWKHRWSMADLQLDGPARDQAYLRFGAFSMLQMAPFHTDNMSVPARAYAYNRYHGLYYWDSETFLMPFYLHTHPEVAEHLLAFRHHTLEGARRTAERLKAPGACYPWMTDSDDGTEQAPWGIGDYVWHQNADIAYALDQYAQATGDLAFMLNRGLEVLVETARFWMSRLERDAAGVVHLHDTVGPDEIDKHGKDNGYTSLMARRHLRLAVSWTDRLRLAFPRECGLLLQKLELGAGELADWTDAASRLAAPLVPGHNFPLQDEFLLAKQPLSFEGLTADEAFAMRHTHRVVKQSDIVLALYLLQDEFTVEQMRDAYDFYEPMTLHYSSLSYNTHAILATKIGRDEQAYDYFLKAAGLDLDNLREATKDGLHAAALSGTWLTVVYGFLGMRLLPDGITFEPRLPAAWQGLTLRIAYRGYRLTLHLSHKETRIEVEGAEGLERATLTLHGETHRLRDGLLIQADLNRAETR